MRVILSAATTAWLLFPGVTPERAAFASNPQPAKAVAEPKGDFVNRAYRGGIVMELSKNSITIICPEVVVHAPQMGAGGVIRWGPKVVPAEPPKRFAVSEALAAGRVPKDPRPGSGRRPYFVGAPDMYRLTDVKVGDHVSIIYARVGGVDICDHIRITKRPGGRVPPLSEEAENLRRIKLPPEIEPPGPYIRYDERMNAYWDLEDKGIPYPEKFGRHRRFPVAPMPRAVPAPRPIQ